jgi:hypothetical protein
MLTDYVIAGDVRGGRLPQGLHPYFLRKAARLAAVAGHAGADHILPLVLAAPVAWDNMVNGQLMRLPATVLAGIAVSDEHLPPGELALRSRALDEVDEADDRRAG